jgi:hypothetical protein
VLRASTTSPNGSVNHARCCEQRNGHEDEGGDALDPVRSAEEQPPDDDSQSAAEDSAQNPVESGLGNEAGKDHPSQPLQYDGEHAGPHSERLRPEVSSGLSVRLSARSSYSCIPS